MRKWVAIANKKAIAVGDTNIQALSEGLRVIKTLKQLK